MAIVQNPIIGKAKQKFGNAVFSTQVGKNTLRTKPLSIKNPRSIVQVAYRNHLKTLVALLRPLKDDINTAYGSSVKGMSPFNRVISINMKQAFDDESNYIVGERLVLCDNEGSRPYSFVLSTTDKPGDVHLTWQSKPQNSAEASADMIFYIFNTQTNKIFKYHFPSHLSRNECTLSLGDQNGALLHIYSCTYDFLNFLDSRPRAIFTYCGLIQMP
jgi:hypothetical protein